MSGRLLFARPRTDLCAPTASIDPDHLDRYEAGIREENRQRYIDQSARTVAGQRAEIEPRQGDRH